MNRELQSAQRFREIVEQCVRRELRTGEELPGAEDDLVEDGPLDSMAWVSVVRSIEVATGCRDFGDRMSDEPRSMNKMLAVLLSSAAPPEKVGATGAERTERRPESSAVVGIAGWAGVVGSRLVDAADVEKEFDLPSGKLKSSAGMQTLARIAEGENELSLCVNACEGALTKAGLDIGEVDTILATSETLAGFPSLGALLHARLLADEACAVFDIGGACVGLLSGLFLAKSLVESGCARCVLVTSGDAHSRVLSPGCVKGEFGGLFGDGASAFILRPADTASSDEYYRLDEFLFGNSGTYASALRIGLTDGCEIALQFEGEALARAAVELIDRVLEDLELCSGRKRSEAAAFALHQPNPRLVHLLARQAGIPLEKIPQVAVNYGNLGPSTCGVALSMALTGNASRPVSGRGPIFVAAVGPGLLWGGAVLF